MAPLAAGILASSPQLHGLLSAVGVLINFSYGFARPTDERGAWDTALSE